MGPTVSINELMAVAEVEIRGVGVEASLPLRIERNSRAVLRGDLFIAIRGERFDGHDFIPEAATNGAAAALVRREWANSASGEPQLPLLIVDDPVAVLQRAAAARRNARDLTVVGITGSVGKTSTKEVVAAILGQRFSAYRSPGNMNSEIGLPWSLLEIAPETEVAVLEMGGAYAFGELTLLSEIAKPKYGVVTNVYPVHLERMGTIEAIAETKAELVDALPEDGAAILNGDDPRVVAMAARCRGRALTYGFSEGNDLRAERVQTYGIDGTSFWLRLEGERLHVKVPLVGSHAVQLALAGIAVGHAMGMHISEMLTGFEDPAIQVRLLILPGPNGSRMLDDTYNASTPSVLSALGLLQELRPRRSIAVLGDMRELGSMTEEEHRIVGRRVAEVADLLVTFGEMARIIAEEAESTAQVDGRALAVTSFGLGQRGDLVDFLRQELRQGDTVLLKGSRGLQMEDFVEALREDAPGRESSA
jgi:UDP-N-acetylmuramoyl-tripeptide--D-alanyl-D-alanine ligase